MFGTTLLMEEWKRRRKKLVLSLLSAACLATVLLGYSSEVGEVGRVAAGSGAATRRRVWVSMSVCFDDSEKGYKKKNFPYLLATELSVSLWKNLTSAGVIVQVVHGGGRESSGEGDLESYLEGLRSLGAKVEAAEVDIALGSCVLQAQLQRAFAFRLSYVSEQDIVVTSDVDVFPMDSSVLSDLDDDDDDVAPRYDTWVYQYETTSRAGVTFGMSFLAMTKAGWRSLLGDTEGPRQLIDAHRDYLNSRFKVWNYDQVLLSRLILQSGRCHLAEHNPLWKDLDLEPVVVEEERDDRCFHGTGFQDCNRDRPSPEDAQRRCRIWHFHPYERERELREKYEEILGIRAPRQGLDKTVQDVRLELAKIMGFRN